MTETLDLAKPENFSISYATNFKHDRYSLPRCTDPYLRGPADYLSNLFLHRQAGDRAQQPWPSRESAVRRPTFRGLSSASCGCHPLSPNGIALRANSGEAMR